jgi:hypothetical protein
VVDSPTIHYAASMGKKSLAAFLEEINSPLIAADFYIYKVCGPLSITDP